MIKGICEEPTAPMIFNGEFPCEISNTVRMPVLITTLQQCAGSSSQSSYTRKRNKWHPNWKGRSKTISVHNDMIFFKTFLFLRDLIYKNISKDCTKKKKK